MKIGEKEVDDNADFSIDDLFKSISTTSDLYFVSLLILNKLQDSKDHKVLAELSYLLDSKSFTNLLWYFEGQTITIPTRKELREVLQSILLYYYCNFKNYKWIDALDAIGADHTNKNISYYYWTLYSKLCDALKDVQLPKDIKEDNSIE